MIFGIMIFVWCAAVPGSTTRGACCRRTAAGATPATGTTPWGFVSQSERCDLPLLAAAVGVVVLRAVGRRTASTSCPSAAPSPSAFVV
jgi:hypothetical protein